MKFKNRETLPSDLKNRKFFTNAIFGENVQYSPPSSDSKMIQANPNYS